MTTQDPLELPAAQARRLANLLLTAETLLSALQARGERGNPIILTHLEELTRLLTSGRSTNRLIGDLEAARHELTAILMHQDPQ